MKIVAKRGNNTDPMLDSTNESRRAGGCKTDSFMMVACSGTTCTALDSCRTGSSLMEIAPVGQAFKHAWQRVHKE